MIMRRNFCKDDRGIALISVMVCIMLSFLLSATILRVSLLSYLQKGVAKQATDTFYENESYLDDIKMGIQQKMAVAMTSSTTKSQATFITNFKKALLGDASWASDKAKVAAALKSMITTTNSTDVSVTVNGDCFVAQGNGEFVIKDVIIEFTDSSKDGYYSKIKTDIRIRSPFYETSSSGGYSMIAGGGSFSVGSGSQAGTVRQKGGIYIGYMNGSYADTTRFSQTFKAAKALEVAGKQNLIYEGDVLMNGDLYISDSSRVVFLGNATIRGTIFISSNSKLIIQDGKTLKCRDIIVNVSEKNASYSVSTPDGGSQSRNYKACNTSGVAKDQSVATATGGYSHTALTSKVSSYLPLANKDYQDIPGGSDSFYSAFDNKGPLFYCTNVNGNEADVYELACGGGAVSGNPTSGTKIVDFSNLVPLENLYDSYYNKKLDREFLRVIDTTYFNSSVGLQNSMKHPDQWKKAAGTATEVGRTCLNPDYNPPTVSNQTQETTKNVYSSSAGKSLDGRSVTRGGVSVNVTLGHGEQNYNQYGHFIVSDQVINLNDMNKNNPYYGIFIAPEIVLASCNEGTTTIYSLAEKFGASKKQAYEDFIDEIGMHYNTDNGGELNSNDKREAHLIDNFFVGGISVLYQNGSEDGDSQKLSKVKNKSLDIVTFENWERQ